MRTPDGRITVKGLLPGQQLVQYPDGKLHVLTSAQLQTGLTPIKSQTTPTSVVKTTVKQTIQQTPTGSVVVWKNNCYIFVFLIFAWQYCKFGKRIWYIYLSFFCIDLLKFC